MNILMTSYTFLPHVGCIEVFTDMLARDFCARGHSLRVVTLTPGDGSDAFPFEVFRRPAPVEFPRLVRWCDVLVQNNISLRLAWPLLLAPRPWVVSIHSGLSGGRGLQRAKFLLKRTVLRSAHVIDDSWGIGRELAGRVTYVPNPYRAELFRRLGEALVPTTWCSWGGSSATRGCMC